MRRPLTDTLYLQASLRAAAERVCADADAPLMDAECILVALGVALADLLRRANRPNPVETAPVTVTVHLAGRAYTARPDDVLAALGMALPECGPALPADFTAPAHVLRRALQHFGAPGPVETAWRPEHATTPRPQPRRPRRSAWLS